MPLYEYKAMDQEGMLVTGKFEAANYEAAALHLEDELQYAPLRLKKKPDSALKSLAEGLQKVTRQDLINFTRQFTTLLRAGVPMLAALDALREQVDNPKMKKVIQELYNDVEGGTSFSGALSKHPKLFSEMYVNTVKAGETAGNLDDVLDNLVQQLERDEETTSELKSALRYPMLVLSGMTIAVVILVTYVIPKFANLFASGNAELPAATQILLATSDFFQAYWMYIVGLIVVGTVAFRQWVKTDSGRHQWDYIKLNLPLFGKIIKLMSVSRFAFVFQTLNESGMPILRSLEVASHAIGNLIIGEAIQKVAARVEKGQGLALPLKETALFPPLVIQMIAVGEESGSLDAMLKNVAVHYEEQVSEITQNIMTYIQPIITLFMGAVVLILAMGVFMPMWSMMDAFQSGM